MKPETYDQPPAMINCPECQARIPNDGNCWYCENNPTYTDQPITLDAGLTFLDSSKRNGRTEFRARLVRAGRITTASGQPAAS